VFLVLIWCLCVLCSDVGFVRLGVLLVCLFVWLLLFFVEAFSVCGLIRVCWLFCLLCFCDLCQEFVLLVGFVIGVVSLLSLLRCLLFVCYVCVCLFIECRWVYLVVIVVALFCRFVCYFCVLFSVLVFFVAWLFVLVC